MAAETETAEARASQEATYWFLMLQEEPDDVALRERFEAWLAADPRNEPAWAATRHTSAIMARVPPAHGDRWQASATTASVGQSVGPRVGRNGDGIGSRAGVSRGVGHGRRRYVRRLVAGSAVALAACLGFLFLPALILDLKADHATGTAEIRTVQLEDGSTLVLAPNSAVEVAYGGAERRIGLLAGEAFFIVRDDPARPFRVVANGVEATDLGTAFAVRLAGTGATVTVETGSVRVDYATVSPSVSEVLQAGQFIRIAWTGAANRGDQAPTQVAAWRQKRLIAQDQPMEDVIDQVRPYFDGKIILTDSALAARRVTGVYNLADPANAVRGIAQAHGAIVHEITPWILIVSGD